MTPTAVPDVVPWKRAGQLAHDRREVIFAAAADHLAVGVPIASGCAALFCEVCLPSAAVAMAAAVALLTCPRFGIPVGKPYDAGAGQTCLDVLEHNPSLCGHVCAEGRAVAEATIVLAGRWVNMDTDTRAVFKWMASEVGVKGYVHLDHRMLQRARRDMIARDHFLRQVPGSSGEPCYDCGGCGVDPMTSETCIICCGLGRVPEIRPLPKINRSKG